MENIHCLQAQQWLLRKIYFLGYKTSLNVFVRTLITQSIFFDHNEVRLDTNNKKMYRISSNINKLNNIFVNDAGDNKEVELRLEIIVN